MGTNELVYKMEIELQMYKKNLMVTGWGEKGRINWEIRIDTYTGLNIK